MTKFKSSKFLIIYHFKFSNFLNYNYIYIYMFQLLLMYLQEDTIEQKMILREKNNTHHNI